MKHVATAVLLSLLVALSASVARAEVQKPKTAWGCYWEYGQVVCDEVDN